MLPILEGGEETLIGGQAVMEGVMMLAPHSCCIAVRKADGQIVTEERPVQKVADRYPIFRYPILRGLGRIGQTMALGSKALKYSFNHAIAEELKSETKPQSKIGSWMMTGSVIFSVLLFIFLYKFVPLFLATSLGHVLPVFSSRFAINMMDGAIRIAIFLAYLLLLSRPKDIQRVFQYHGAEHKVVFNFESGKPLSVENAQKFTTFHPRCGTCFLLVMLVIATIVYALLPVDGFMAKFLLRIACLPLIVGLSYELIRFAARRQGTLLGMLTAPGLWLQRITTKPPDDTQAAVAIHALNGAMEMEARQGGQLVVA
ncbi:MAG TPA: DUF1385 domain-containing protein [Bryobacteraceae bacterium]|jgi:uncharacterized protein YqhQ